MASLVTLGGSCRRFSSIASPAFRTLAGAKPTLGGMASWECPACTFLNPPTQKSTCQICLSPSTTSSSSSSSSSSSLRWSCKACTFSNPTTNIACEVCGTKPASLIAMTRRSSSFGELGADEIAESSTGSVFWPLRRCSAKSAAVDFDERNGGDGGEFGSSHTKKKVKVDGRQEDVVEKDVIKILSYNVWFREDMEVYERMKSLGDLIRRNSPDVIFFQEVTPNIYEIFRKATWWCDYKCPVSAMVAAERPYFCMQMSKLPVQEFSVKPFGNSIMGRELSIARVDVGMGKRLVLATSHLESPCPAPPRWDQMYSQERIAQAKESLCLLKEHTNAIFGGDMNWDDKLDGPFPLQEGWIDPWVELHPGENGWTYDTKANQMLHGNRKLQKRLDRFACKLQDFRIASIDMIGQEAIPDLSYVKEKKVKAQMQKLVLPVLPSDHFGLLLTIRCL